MSKETPETSYKPISLVIPTNSDEVSVIKSLETCLKGDWLKKWPRSLPLYTVNNQVNGNVVIQPNQNGNCSKKCFFNIYRGYRWYSCQIRGGSHKRFFWIEQLTTGQWALRWSSNRKHSSESLIILGTVTSITKGCDVEFLNSQSILGSNINCIFIISSNETSMQLEAETEELASQWIYSLSVVAYASISKLIYPYFKEYDFSLKNEKEYIESLKHMDIISNPSRCRHLRNFTEMEAAKRGANEKEPTETETAEEENIKKYYELLQNIIIDKSIDSLLLKSDYIDIQYNTNYDEKNDVNYKVIENERYQDFTAKVQNLDFLHQGISLLNIQSLNSPFALKRDDEKLAKLTSLGFHWLLRRPENSIFRPVKYSEISSKTLSEFIIASSHNTYLIGDQIGGSAQPSGLASALIRGCRCIELDIQDGPDGEPRLYHSLIGYKMSGCFPLRESLMAIKSSAFISSKLPVILSIQMKSSDPQKYTVYSLFNSILGDSIFVPESRDQIDTIPISDLCNKFIIKAKLFPPHSIKYSPGQRAWEKIVALEGVSLSSHEYLDREIKPYQVCSISENHYLNLLKSPEKLSKLSNSCFVRIYPSGTRVTSTNFCPLNPWSLGVHFVALNYQSCDRSMLINQGWFDNSFGYIPRDIGGGAPIHLSFHVLSATQLPLLGISDVTLEDANLFVTVTLVSDTHRSQDNCVYKTSSLHIKNDTSDPVWADVSPPININVKRPEYSALVIQLKNGETFGSGVLLGQASIPVYRILPGIRWIPLLDRRLRPISSSGILVNTIITTG